MASAVDGRGMTCLYGATAALRGVDLSLAAGGWTTLVGPSASGKTTLLRVLAGLEPLASGEVRIGEALATDHIVRLAPHERGIGLQFQEPSLWPHLTALENVALGLPPGVARRERRAQALEWLRRFGVEQVAARPPGALSGGEARRVTLARTLAARPALLLLDEPTAHLDLHLREELMQLLRNLHAELKLTTLCVTHQIEPPFDGTDRLIVLEEGRIAYDGTIDEFAGSGRSQDAGLAGVNFEAKGTKGATPAAGAASPFMHALRRALRLHGAG